MYYGVEFYSKNRDVILADRVKEVLSHKDLGVLYIDDIDDFIIERDNVIRYLIINLEEDINEKILDLLKKMLNKGLLDSVIIVSQTKVYFGDEFSYILKDEDFGQNLSNLFDNFLSNEEVKSEVLTKSHKALISEALYNWGLSSKVNGFAMLVDIIDYYIHKRCVIKSLSKEAYVAMARRYSVSTICVDINVNKVIKQASKNLDSFSVGKFTTSKSFIVYATIQLYDKIKKMYQE